MTGRSVIVGSRRVAAITAVLGLFAVGAYSVHLVRTTELFSSTAFAPATFRQARLERDGGTLRSQADAAVQAGALIGLSPAKLKRMLDPPTSTERRGHRYVWSLGESGWFVGSGPVVLNVDIDARTRRVEYAE